MARFRLASILLVLALALPFSWMSSARPADEQPPPTPTIDFNRQIRPILADNCFACHGPDDKQRKAKMRLDTEEGLFRDGRIIVPGKAASSELIRRVSSDNPKVHMPPEKTGKNLTSEQIALLKQWIDQGAKWSNHWSLVPPRRPPLPEVKNKNGLQNPIDRFIRARLEREGLKPSTETDRTTLIRRVTLDLTGLPPTPSEIDAFLKDDSLNAYEKLVDRLLRSERYGERMALEWLDAARYADTNGYHIDNGRDMTRWREWVIDAFNNNMPFDQFTIEQVAGDLLPNATVSQKIASGFNRNHMINFEGGAIPAEYLSAYIVDRVNTTTTIWLGLTVGCAQCHDHKYDPISQKEFYQLYAFFHNVPENGLDGRTGNATPLLKTPTKQQQEQLDQLTASLKKIEQQLAGPMPEADAEQVEWEKSLSVEKKIEWALLDPTESKSTGGTTLTKLDDKSIRASGTNPATDTYEVTARTQVKKITAVRLEALTDDSLPGNGPGRSENGNVVLTNVVVKARPVGKDGAVKPVKLKTASASFSQQDFPIAYAIDDKPKTGWAIHPQTGKPHTAVLGFDQPLGEDNEVELTITLEFRSQFASHQFGRFRLAVTDSSDPHGNVKIPANILAAASLPAEKRSDQQKTELLSYYRGQVSPRTKPLRDEAAKLQQARAALDKEIRTSMVMEEMPKPRDTFVLTRGQYDKPGEKVTAGVPACLPPLPKDAPTNRLGLARWLVDPGHPLMARVIVNRFWQMYFGTGLVKTAEDFGVQGEQPSHPDLLDWLAVDFRENGWDVKRLQRLIVASATYRQSSKVTPEHLSKDPDNRLLARQSRLRLHAEFIRDQALAVSGLLNGEIGGASVSPYQPPGIWEELAYRQDGKNWTAQSYVQSKGKDLYRRSMYTFWKRTAPPPTMLTFDAPDRETCTVRRSRTNTPLQALILMNDPTYVEASRKLAERMMTEAVTPHDRIAFAFELATARKPTANEVAVLRRVFDGQVASYRKDEKAALKLLSVGESPRNQKLDAAELAGWTMVASVILNLDETVTRN